MFTEKQVRQFYVATSTANDVIAPIKADSSHKATDLTAKSAGACQFITTPDGDAAYMLYKGPSDDGLQRSDIIKRCNIVSVALTDASDMVHKNKKAVLTLDPSLVTSNNLNTTGDYILNINVQNYIALGDDSIRIKTAAVRGVSGASASSFYLKLASSIAKNFAREGAPMIKVGVSTAATGASPVEVTAKSDITDTTTFSGTYAAVTIEEVAQPWRRGAAKVEYVNFEVLPSTVYAGGADVIWGKVQFYGSAKYTDGTSSSATVAAGGTQANSKEVADMEYFFHKERGDVYGEQGWPNNIDTVYQVDPANTDGYSFVDIHFYFEGNSHNVGRSEKTLTIVGTKTLLKKLIGSAATTGQNAAAATGLYALLEGTGVTPRTSDHW